MSIAVFGSINIDLAAYSERLPRPGETVHGTSYALGLGGKGCNQAAAARRLGADTILVGRVGRDEFGNRALSEIAGLDLAPDAIEVDPQNPTGLAVIGVDAYAQNCITVVGGANMAIDAGDVDRNGAVFRKADILLLQLEIPLAAGLQAAEMVREAGGKVILDPAPAPPGGLPPEVFARVDFLTPNETETELLTGLRPANAEEAAEAAQRLRARGIPGVIVKLGATGVYFQTADGDGFVPPFEVESIDSVAAGDCFNGGLAVALSEGRPIGEAVRMAAACGALSTTKAGASASAPTRRELDALLGRQ